MGCKETLEGYLREQKVPFQVQHHAIAYTAQEIAALEHVPGNTLAKVVMVLADGELAMVALPAPSRVDLRKVAAALGANVARLAEEREFASAFPDGDLGAMPPFGNLYGLTICVDQALAEDETIVFNAGTHTDTMSLKYADFARLVQPKVADIREEE
ncbi:MAG: YbaK/EbsC family protein [Dehalococcoidia bacterium]